MALLCMVLLDSLVTVSVEVSSSSVALATVELPFVSRPRGVVVRALPVRLAIAPLPHVPVARGVPRGPLSWKHTSKLLDMLTNRMQTSRRDSRGWLSPPHEGNYVRTCMAHVSVVGPQDVLAVGPYTTLQHLYRQAKA